MKIIFPGNTPAKDMHHYMLGTITPRPIAFVSTLNKNGVNNLAPFSYFNAISSNPPILVFSVNRKPDGSKKDTLLNIEETRDCVVNMVNTKIVNQMVLSSVAFEHGIDEFEKSGLTPSQSQTVVPFGIREANVRFECKLDRVIHFGDFGGASSLVICNVTCIHIADKVFDKNDKIDPVKLENIGRLGRSFYIKMTKENVFSIPHIKTKSPLGFDKLPKSITNSEVLSGSEISHIASLEKLPNKDEVSYLKHLLDSFGKEIVHQIAGAEIHNGDIESAAKLLMLVEYYG